MATKTATRPATTTRPADGPAAIEKVAPVPAAILVVDLVRPPGRLVAEMRPFTGATAPDTHVTVRLVETFGKVGAVETVAACLVSPLATPDRRPMGPRLATVVTANEGARQAKVVAEEEVDAASPSAPAANTGRHAVVVALEMVPETVRGRPTSDVTRPDVPRVVDRRLAALDVGLETKAVLGLEMVVAETGLVSD